MNWTGNELVKWGKWRGCRWATLGASSVEWYAGYDNKHAALKEEAKAEKERRRLLSIEDRTGWDGIKWNEDERKLLIDRGIIEE